MRSFYDDVRFGLRLLKGSPGFTAIAIFTLALGIAANATVFSWIDGLLLHPYGGSRDSQQLAVIEMKTSFAPNGANQMSYRDYADYQGMKSVEGIALHREDVFSIGEGASAQPVWGELVSGNYFAVLRMQPALGRVFTSDEYAEKLGAFPVAVISDKLWRTRFRGDSALVGKTIRVNRHWLTVAGIAPPEFHGTMAGLAFDIWVPITMGPELGLTPEGMFRSRSWRNMYALARLKPGVRMEQARAEATMLARNLAAAYPKTNGQVDATVLAPWQQHTGAPELLLGPLRILMGVSVLMLMIVCANVANLLLSRSVSRQKEFAIRRALGAGRLRVARQLLSEALLLAAGGALVGIPLALWMSEALPSIVPRIGVTMAAGFRMNGPVLLFTSLTCVLAALSSGVAPVIFSMRADVNENLKEGGRTGTAGANSHRIRGLLVMGEVALAAVALVGAGLFLRSFQNAKNINPGFDRSNVVMARFHLAPAGYTVPQLQQFCLRLRERLESDPGIVHANYADFVPLGSSAGPYTPIQVEGYVAARNDSMEINRSLVAPGHFDLLHTPLLAGRDFTNNDDTTAAPVIMVNESFARRFFPSGSVIGRHVQAWGKWHTVIGMVKDSKYFDVTEAARPHFYAPFRQAFGNGDVYFFVKTAGDMNQGIAALRREVGAIDPNAGAFQAMALTDWTDVTLLPQKAAASLTGGLGILSLLLAAVGLYSVMAYAVSQRTQEIGIRMALGAERRDVMRDVLGRGMMLTGAGFAVGMVLAWGAARLVASMLVNLSPGDPLTFGGTAVFLGVVAMVASYIPALRATRVDPMTALRNE